MINWNNIEDSLILTYKNNKKEISNLEIDYLKKAFFFTENLWLEQFNKIDKIKFVLISEAPLFGPNKSYFYNPETKFSSFFYFKDIEAFDIQYQKKDYNNKQFVINALNKRGFIILDIFPYALNQNNTQLNYNTLKRSDYKELFTSNLDNYINTKLEFIKSKSSNNIVFSYRYKRLKDQLHKLWENKLVEYNFIQKNENLEALNNNMSLNKAKLKEILKSNQI